CCSKRLSRLLLLLPYHRYHRGLSSPARLVFSRSSLRGISTLRAGERVGDLAFLAPEDGIQQHSPKRRDLEVLHMAEGGVEDAGALVGIGPGHRLVLLLAFEPAFHERRRGFGQVAALVKGRAYPN